MGYELGLGPSSNIKIQITMLERFLAYDLNVTGQQFTFCLSLAIYSQVQTSWKLTVLSFSACSVIYLLLKT